MRKRLLLLAVTVPVLFIFFSFSYLTYGLNNALCNVPANYATVQTAVDDANCDTINVAAGTYTEYVTINRDVVIEGAGAGTTIFDGLDAGRPFTILAPAANVTLRNFAVQNGQAISGGAIFNESVLTLDTLFFTSNDSTEDGGAVYSTNDLTIESGFFQVNGAGRNGGAVYLAGAALNYLQVDINNTTFMFNNAVTSGGALNITFAETNLNATYFDTNSAQTGGAVYEYCGNVTMIGGSGGNNHATALGGFLNSGCGLATDVTTFWNTSILQNISDVDGGAIYRVGKMEIHSSSFTSNIADNHGGAIYTTEGEFYDSDFIYNYGDIGGAIYLVGGSGEAIIDNSRISYNTIDTEHYAALYSGSGVSMTVSHSEINNNQGAGLYNAGTLTVYDTKIMTNTRGVYNATPVYPTLISRSTIANNILELPLTWHDGAGIRNWGPLAIRNSVINNNQALGVGGGIASNGPLTLTNVTISGNRADDSGGGIWHNNDDPATFRGVTIYDNVAGDTAMDDGNGGGIFIYSDPTPENVVIRNSIVAENRDLRNPDGLHQDCSGIINAASYTLFGIDTGCTIPAGTGNIVGTAVSPETADLNPLADNGGATFTHEPQNSSQVLNNGSCANIDSDQRGVARIVGACDLGAYEDNTCPTPIVPDVDISLIYGNAELQWTRVPDAQMLFKVYHSNAHYLDPTPDLIKRTVGERYLYSNVTGSIYTNHYFSIRAGNACGDYSSRDVVGVFNFSVEPGS